MRAFAGGGAGWAGSTVLGAEQLTIRAALKSIVTDRVGNVEIAVWVVAEQDIALVAVHEASDGLVPGEVVQAG